MSTQEDLKTTVTVDEIFPHIVGLRRHFHQHPELAYEEVETARRVMEELDRLGISYEYGGKGGGVVGRLESTSPGGTVALRAEMDGLACNERTGQPFASQVPGRMHACGHDVHMAMVLGAAALLKASPPPGTVLFVFQPAEESGSGACAVIDAGMLGDTQAIFAAHVTHHYRLGEVMVSPGTITSPCRSIHDSRTRQGRTRRAPTRGGRCGGRRRPADHGDPDIGLA